MSKVLVKWSDNWADEMDLEGFAVMESQEWKDIKKKFEKHDHGFDISVGTNEDIDYSDGKDFLRHIETKNISDDEAKMLKKLFGEGNFGMFPVSWALETIEEEDLEVNDEERDEEEED